MARRGGRGLTAFESTPELVQAFQTLKWPYRELSKFRLGSRISPAIMLITHLTDRRRTALMLMVHDLTPFEIDRPTLLKTINRYRDLYIRGSIEGRFKRRIASAGNREPEFNLLLRSVAEMERYQALRHAGLEANEYDHRSTFRRMHSEIDRIESRLHFERKLAKIEANIPELVAQAISRFKSDG